MPLTVAGSIRLNPILTKLADLVPAPGLAAAPNIIVDLALADGVGLGQANKCFWDQIVLAASANVELDLTGDVTFKDIFGDALNFAKIKFIYVLAAAGNTNDVIVGGAATNTFLGPFGAAAHTIAIAPGEPYIQRKRALAGWPVVAGTGDKLKFANGGAGTSVTFDVLLAGTDA